MEYRYEVFSAEPISKNKHSVVLFSPLRPDSSQELVSYYNNLVLEFAKSYHCVLIKIDDVRLSHFRESALIFITVSTKKKKLAKMYELNKLFHKPFA
jgi:hypothetical protein